MERQGLMLNIQRLSTEDGPGLRTTVFFKGCNLRCAWCHNPESICAAKQVEWHENACIGCGLCVKACPRGALRRDGSGIWVDRQLCNACETCVGICPGGAMEVKGVAWSAQDLAAELFKDSAYFGQDGGVTLSGGEALLQLDFCRQLLGLVKGAGIGCALDTAGLVSWAALDSVLPLVDLVLYDLKLWDDGAHRRWTGAPNAVILDNAVRLAGYIKAHGRPALWIRTPVIPGATDSPENIAALAKFIKSELGDAIQKWELCAFNNLCRDKYRRLDTPWAFEEAGLVTQEHMERLHAIARAGMGDLAGRVQWSGATAVPKENNA